MSYDRYTSGSALSWMKKFWTKIILRTHCRYWGDLDLVKFLRGRGFLMIAIWLFIKDHSSLQFGYPSFRVLWYIHHKASLKQYLLFPFHWQMISCSNIAWRTCRLLNENPVVTPAEFSIIVWQVSRACHGFFIFRWLSYRQK